MKTLRDVVTDSIQNMLVWGVPNAPSSPVDTDFNKGLLKQSSTSGLKGYRALPKEDGSDTHEPNIRIKIDDTEVPYSTPLWRIYRRPTSPKVPNQDKEIPCAFIYSIRGVPDEETSSDIGDNVESMMVGVDVLLDEKFGALDENNKPKELTDQINGVVDDLFMLLNPVKLTKAEFSVFDFWKEISAKLRRGDEMAIVESQILLWESGVSDDIVQDALPYEIVRVILELTIEFPTDLGVD